MAGTVRGTRRAAGSTGILRKIAGRLALAAGSVAAGPPVGGERETEALRFAGAPPAWIVVLIVIPLVVAFVTVVYRNDASHLSSRRRALLAGLRALAIGLGLAILFEPLAETRTHLVTPSAVAVLLDDSSSMTLPDDYGDEDARESLREAAGLASSENPSGFSRLDLARGVLGGEDRGLLASLAKNHEVHLYLFGTGVRAATSPAEARGEDAETRLGDAVLRVLQDFRGRSLAGIVALTDGRNTAGRDPRDAARVAAEEEVPLHLLGAGVATMPRNVSLRRLEAPDAALVQDEIAFEVTLRASGYEAQPATLVLRRAGETTPLATKEFLLRAEDAEQKVTIYHRPPEPGDWVYVLEVPPRPDEVLDDDNRLTHRVHVEPEKIKVLYAEGYPRWEYRYLKNLLIRSTDHFEVQVLLQSADPAYVQESSPGTDPLDRFPRTLEELVPYDVIVMGDVDPYSLAPTTAGCDEILENVRSFVELGGGFLMIAGDRWSPRRYAGTPVEVLLPVLLGEEDTAPPIPRDRGFRPRPAFLEELPDLLRLEEDPDEARRLWGDDPAWALPPLYWFYPVHDKKPGAEVWLRHPELGNRRGRYVLLATTYYPAGKTGFLGIDETWRWRFRYGDRYFERFWRNVLRTLALPKLRRGSKRFELDTDRTVYDIRDRVLVSARARDESYRPLRAESFEIQIQRPGALPEALALSPRPEEPGTYERWLQPGDPGEYLVWVEGAGQDLGKRLSPRSFVVRLPAGEKENPILDEALLQDLARTSGGDFLPLAQAARLPDRLEPRPTILPVAVQQRELWDRWWVLVLWVAVLALEWATRKTWRML